MAFWVYLVIVNLAAWGLYLAADRLHHAGSGKIIHPSLLNLLTLAGGSLGTLAAYVTAELRFRRPAESHEERQQDNLRYGEWLHAVMLMSVQLFIGLFFFGPRSGACREWAAWLWSAHPVLCVYLAAVNLAALVLFGLDKLFAVLKQRRIPERVLLCVCFFGGSAGGWVGMDLFNHKKTHPQFSAGLPMILITHIVLFCIFTLDLL